MKLNTLIKKYIKLPKGFFNELDVEIKLPQITHFHEQCPKCKELRDEKMKLLLSDLKN